MKRLVLIALILAPTLALAMPRAVFACVCYDSAGATQTPDATDECNTACGNTTATESASSPGICDCGTRSEPLNCSTVCSQYGYTLTQPATSASAPLVKYQTPQLNVKIPGVSFDTPILTNGEASSNFIGTYIAGVYKYLIGFAMTVSIVMIMIGGLRYVIGGVSAKEVSAGKKIMVQASEGFVLLLFVYVILYTTNPELIFSRDIRLTQIDQIKLSLDTSGDEGQASTCGGISTYKDMPEPYKSIIAAAKAGGSCPLTGSDPYDSPTGKPPNCGTHHWYDRGVDGDWEKDHNLDYAATWGTSFHSPFAGKVSYQIRSTAENPCGNTITLTGENGVKAYICHAKDFVDDGGARLTDGSTVLKGQVLGHIGGRCCAGEKTPSNWSAGKYCTFTGTACTDPNALEPSCACQKAAQSGNTTGPHVHITWAGDGNILACLDD